MFALGQNRHARQGGLPSIHSSEGAAAVGRETEGETVSDLRSDLGPRLYRRRRRPIRMWRGPAYRFLRGGGTGGDRRAAPRIPQEGRSRSVLEASMAAMRRSADFGLASRMHWSSAAMASDAFTSLGVLLPRSSSDHQHRWGAGSRSRPLRCFPGWCGRLAKSCSQSEAPTSTPMAAREMLAMPPPMARRSKLVTKIVQEVELGGDLRADANGRWGDPKAASRAAVGRPAWNDRHRPAGGASPSVEAGSGARRKKRRLT